jgi:ABC-type proline/glycine betaine transport system ATPase subunit
MDEPFAALDFQTRLAMQELRCGLWHEIHPKIFFITHDVEEAIFLADRVYVMSAAPGRIKEVLDVPFPKPRTIDIVTMAEFVAIKDHVLRLIRSEFQLRSATKSAARQALASLTGAVRMAADDGRGPRRSLLECAGPIRLAQDPRYPDQHSRFGA